MERDIAEVGGAKIGARHMGQREVGRSPAIWGSWQTSQQVLQKAWPGDRYLKDANSQGLLNQPQGVYNRSSAS